MGIWKSLALLCLVSIVSTLDSPQASSAESENVAFFENQVRPLLVEHCYECHSGDDVEASLWLDTRQGWQTGGDSGATIFPGDPEKSLFMDAVSYTEDRIAGMPPAEKLSPEEIDVFRKWIVQGAVDPREASGNEARGERFHLEQRRAAHWSWQPIRSPTPPSDAKDHWSVTDVDRFIHRDLKASNLIPAQDADKLTWLRRVTFDLTGLPPTPTEIRDFELDVALDAKSTVVDRLLGSQHFGEAWARHWMDLVRYADTFGHEFDYEIPYAHEYRDYLIRAFNTDLPFDQFVSEQLAGDLVPQPRLHPTQQFNESIIGTGFWHLHEATHAPTDAAQNESDITANQIDVFGKAFLGLTVACARCHDHKFDAISTADYYAMFAHLESSARQKFPLDAGQRNHATRWTIQKTRQRCNELQSATAWLDDDATKQSLLTKWNAAASESKDFSSSSDAVPSDLQNNATLLADFRGKAFPENWHRNGWAFEPVGDDLPSLLTAGNHAARADTIDSGFNGPKAVGALISPSFVLTAPNIHLRVRSDADQTINLVIDHYDLSEHHQLLFKGSLLNGKQTDTGGKWKWLTMRGDLGKYLGRRVHLHIMDHNHGSIAIDQIWMSDDATPPSAPNGSRAEDPRESDFDQQWALMRQSINDGKVSPLLRWIIEQDELPGDLGERISAIGDQLQQASSQFRPARFVLAISQNGFVEQPVYIRGAHNNLGNSVPPRNLSALGAQTGDRLQLAREITSTDNPLTARVFVNRIWHHLFGRGIVASVDDFGPQGVAPSHPELLDHLASEFVADQWSIKRLIKRLVLSRTYGQASVANPDLDVQWVAQTDPTNVLLHRANVRRLTAESIRDAILASSGNMDPKPFGPSVATHLTRFMTGRGIRKSGPLDGNGRRTVYLSVYRNFLNPFLTSFDMPNPFGPKGRRSQSNVPAQSLALMNDPFVVDQAKRWTEKARVLQREPRELINDWVVRAHGRYPTETQTDQLLAFVETQTQARDGDARAAWQDLAQTLWSMKAFLYLR